MTGSKPGILSVVLVMALISGAATADRVILTDGRTFEGTATIQGDTVTIEMAYGTISLSREKVLRIEFRDTPAQQLEKKLSAIEPGDTDAMLELALWARENGLEDRAEQICNRIIELDSEHAGARHALGNIKIDGEWRTFDKAMELSQSKFHAGQFDHLVNEVLPEVLAAAPSQADKLRAKRLLARSFLRGGKFSRASQTYLDLAYAANEPESIRYAVIGEILRENPDGMYVLKEPYPPAAGLLGKQHPGEKSLKPGPASLSEPMVLQAALRQQAKKMIQAGRESMRQADKIESINAPGALAKYALAEKDFDRADALVEGISRSYRVEIARRRIASVREIVESDAKKFDAEKEKLGKENLSPRGYTGVIIRMNHYLNNVREELEEILQIAEPYPRELVLEIKWAQADLKKIDEMQEVLVAELDDHK